MMIVTAQEKEILKILQGVQHLHTVYLKLYSHA